jgi:multicomponent Na+:H+ antiporter subunit D
MGLSIGAGLAGNFFTLIFFYTASIPTIIPLIQIRGDDISRAAARYYFRATFLPAIGIIIPTVVILFPADVPFQDLHIRAMGWSHTKASLALALLVVGFSKNCVAPFHLWLPNSAVAPAPITALIHSVAAVQTASIALFKVAKHTYGEELLQDLSDHIFETGWLIYLCGGTAVYTAYRAWKTPDLKQRFSFSTVGQLSYIITAIVVGSHQCMQGALLHIMTHSFAKLNLFFCAGAYVTAFGTVQGPEVARFIPHRRWLGVAAMISGLSIGGFPFLAGYYSKDIMLLEELHRHHYSAALFLLAGSILNFIYIFPIIRATFSRKQSLKQPIASLSITMTAAIVLCTGIILALSHYVYYVMRYLEY